MTTTAMSATATPFAVAAPDDHLRFPDHTFEAYVFDLDGTVYLGETLLPGAHRAITELRRRGHAVRFLSNNPTKDPAQYARKLERLGLETPVEHIVNTVTAMTGWLQQHHPDAVVYPIAEVPLQQALIRAGFRLSEDPAEIDVVIASYDRGFTYRKLQIAFDAVRRSGALLVTTNPDAYCPLPGGAAEPDAAAIVGAIEACTGVACVKNVGKPDPAILETALSGIDAPLNRCLMIGDRVQTDILMAQNAGMPAALVLTGEADAADARRLLAEGFDGYSLDRLDRLLPAAVWAELGWEE